MSNDNTYSPGGLAPGLKNRQRDENGDVYDDYMSEVLASVVQGPCSGQDRPSWADDGLPPRGHVLYGFPGTGKTTAIKWLTNMGLRVADSDTVRSRLFAMGAIRTKSGRCLTTSPYMLEDRVLYYKVLDSVRSNVDIMLTNEYESGTIFTEKPRLGFFMHPDDPRVQKRMRVGVFAEGSDEPNVANIWPVYAHQAWKARFSICDEPIMLDERTFISSVGPMRNLVKAAYWLFPEERVLENDARWTL